MIERRYPKLKITLDLEPTDYAEVDVPVVRRKDPQPPQELGCVLCGALHPWWHFNEEMREGKTPPICMPCLNFGSTRSFGKRDWTLPLADQCFLENAGTAVRVLEREAKHARAR